MILHIGIFFLDISGIVTLLIQESDTLTKNQELGPILEPNPIKFTFDTPGWYILGVTILILILFGIIRSIKNYRENSYRRDAIKKLDELKSPRSEIDSEQKLSELLTVLKLVALKTYGRKEVARLHGEKWFLFLESKAKSISFSKYVPLISKSIYQSIPMEAKELNELKNLSKKWIRKHA